MRVLTLVAWVGAISLAGCSDDASLGDLTNQDGGSGGTDGGVGGSGGTSGNGGTGGSGGSECDPVPACNWCGGTQVTDNDGCVVGFVCANGADPCTTNPCSSDPTECTADEVCGDDDLCWPSDAGVGADACPPLPSCNWCGGSYVTDANGCAVGFECANGADPCTTNPCSSDPTECTADEVCGDDDLCWPSDAGVGADACPPLPSCNWCGGSYVTDANGCAVGFECANGADPCVVDPCSSDPSVCKADEVCGTDNLCWPADAG